MIANAANRLPAAPRDAWKAKAPSCAWAAPITHRNASTRNSGASSASPIVIDFEPMDASVMSCDFPSLLTASREIRARRRRFEEDQVPQWIARAGPSNGLLHAGRNNPLLCSRKASLRPLLDPCQAKVGSGSDTGAKNRVEQRAR